MNDLFVSRAIFAMAFLQWVQVSSQMGTNYTHCLYIDNDKNYYLSWKFDQKEIFFEVVVNTTGYVGFGFSADGTMANSDIVIGQVKNGQSSLEDYHGFANGTLVKDAIANWNLSSATNMDDNTRLKLEFKRKLVTNDPNDVDITSSTMRVIWAYGDGNFSKENFTIGGYKSLYLLQIARPDVAIPDDALKLNVTMDEVLIPNDTTTYLCQYVERPGYEKDMHIIKLYPSVAKGNENLVHHMLLYRCKERNGRREEAHLCYEENMPKSNDDCYLVYGWAVGGSAFPLPAHVGLPIKASTDPILFLLEIHYDNPREQSGVHDSSGFEMILTPSLRKFDAAVLEMGQAASDRDHRYIQMIPPYQPHFTYNGVCRSKCMFEIFPHENKTVAMKIFAVFLHAHLLATQLVLHHYRNGTELANIAYDRNYDFNYQEMVFLKKEVEVLQGDDLKIECVYNTMKKKTFTWGGLATTDEMCLAFPMYYPKISTVRCISAIKDEDAKWETYNSNTSNLIQFKNKEFAKTFERTVNGVEGNPSILHYCSDGKAIDAQLEPAGNILNILKYEKPYTTSTPSTPSTPTTTTVVTKAGVGAVTIFHWSMWVLSLASLLLH